MNLVNTRLPRLLASILTVAASIVGLVLIGVLPVLNAAGGPVTLGDYISQIIYLLKNMGSINPSTITLYIHSIANVIVYLVTYITATVFLIKCIVSFAKFKREGSSKRIVFDSLKLSFTLLIFFGFSVFFNYFAQTTTIAIGGYLALALGGGAALFALINYFMASQREPLNKCLRICFVLVAAAASIFALMPTITMADAPTAPGLFLFSTIQSMVSSGTVDTTVLAGAFSMFVFFVVAYSFVSNEAAKIIDERKKNDGRSVASIVLSAIALVLTVSALFGARLIISTNDIGVSTFGILSIVLMTLTLGLAILVFVMTKKEEVSVTPVEFTQYHEEPVEEPVEEEKVEEVSEEEAPVEEEKEETPAEEPVKEEVVAAVVAREAVEEEKVEEPVKEKPAKKSPAKAEAPKEKAAPKKKAPAKKEEKKEEDKEAKKNASYHISKRASDNKWQVFRAGSEKVIKLFDTKVEAEEYTKRMAENQGVGYLSHASKGKNKGRIQKK